MLPLDTPFFASIIVGTKTVRRDKSLAISKHNADYCLFVEEYLLLVLHLAFAILWRSQRTLNQSLHGT